MGLLDERVGVDGRRMKDIAHRMGVGGRQRMRVEQRGDTDDAEMREVLSDWYNKELHKKDKANAVILFLVKVSRTPASMCGPWLRDSGNILKLLRKA